MKLRTLLILSALGSTLGTVARANELSSGSAAIDYDVAAWAQLASGIAPTPNLFPDEAFDRAFCDANNSGTLLSIEIDANPAMTGLVYDMYGDSVTNLPGRTAQPTTFAYTPGNLTGHTGVIGLGGMTRWSVDLDAGGGVLLYGDFTLQYDVARQAVGGSGWYLAANVPPAAPAFDLLNVTTSEANGQVLIAGDLCVTFEVANFLYGTPSDTLADVGDFSFVGNVEYPSFCDAGDGALASCPCSNPGAPDSGCDNAQSTGGVSLSVLAQTTSPNGATLQGTGFPAAGSPTAIVIRAPSLDASSPVVFGDGVRCVSTIGLVRLAATTAIGGTSTHALGHGAASGSFYYQLWYRNTPSTFCDPFAAFNLSSGRQLSW